MYSLAVATLKMQLCGTLYERILESFRTDFYGRLINNPAQSALLRLN